MAKLVIIYTLNYCGYCAKLKKQLDEKGITHISKDIEDKIHEKEYEIMKNRCGNELVPLIRIGNKLLVADIDFDTIDDAVEAISANL
jgi:mycoredoxin